MTYVHGNDPCSRATINHCGQETTQPNSNVDGQLERKEKGHQVISRATLEKKYEKF